MPSRWIELHRSAGDANIGQTLLRLAGLAESVHRAEHAAQPIRRDETQSQSWVEGLDPALRPADGDALLADASRLALVHTVIDHGPRGAAEGTAIHKEVNR